MAGAVRRLLRSQPRMGADMPNVISPEAACKPSSVPGPIRIGPATAIHLSDLPEG